MSFGQIAGDYDRVRPGPPEAALDWLMPPDCGVAVDVGAGTGLFSRALRHRGTQVVAVEPDDRMRVVLAARSPGIAVVAGRGEAIPVQDASADGVFVASAWHWLDAALAVREIARVLRDGGRFGAIWTNRDPEADWGAELESSQGFRSAWADRSWRPRREVTLPEGEPFVNVATASFTFTRTMTVDNAIDWMNTYSAVITAPAGRQAAERAHAREALLRRADEDGMIEVPMRSNCWRADRAPRP